MKRLVVCCDGTWKKADDKYVSNIEKIARAIKIRDGGNADTLQLVHYSSGVGSGPIRTWSAFSAVHSVLGQSTKTCSLHIDSWH